MAKEAIQETGYKAITRFLIVSPYKIRPVAALIRRKPYPEAVAILENMPQKGARLIRKTVVSAASNALNKNKQLAEDMLYVKSVQIDEGPRMRRVWFRGRGRADMLLKRMSHITVVIDETASIGSSKQQTGSPETNKSAAPKKRAKSSKAKAGK